MLIQQNKFYVHAVFYDRCHQDKINSLIATVFNDNREYLAFNSYRRFSISASCDNTIRPGAVATVVDPGIEKSGLAAIFKNPARNLVRDRYFQ